MKKSINETVIATVSETPELIVEQGLNQGVERHSAILRALGQAGKRGARMTDLAIATGLNKSTTHRLLRALMRAGFVEQDEGTSAFYLGFDLFVLGSIAANRFGILDLAREHLISLAQKTEDTVFLSVRSRGEAICIAREEGSYPIKVLTLEVGDRRPLGVGAGSLALLAALPDKERQRVIETSSAAARFGRFTRSELETLVRTTQEIGYAFNGGLIVSGMCAVGLPVRNRFGAPLAAISIAAINDRMSASRQSMIVQAMAAQIASLEQRINELTAELPEGRLLELFSHP